DRGRPTGGRGRCAANSATAAMTPSSRTPARTAAPREADERALAGRAHDHSPIPGRAGVAAGRRPALPPIEDHRAHPADVSTSTASTGTPGVLPRVVA